MKRQIFPAIKMLLVLTVLTGVLYPLAMTGVALAVFPHQASGSLIEQDGRVIGSELIAQKFTKPEYFWPRPSAIDYNPLPSGGSNYGPTSDTLRKLIGLREHDFRTRNGISDGISIPPEMVTASGSGLDPEITPMAAMLQINRIADARGFNGEQRARLQRLVEKYTEGPQMGLFGETRVNVLRLNLALDRGQ